MNYYKPKPCDIVAHQVTTENLEELAHWCGGMVKNRKLLTIHREIEIFTLDADFTAEVGDFIAYNVDTDAYSVYSEEAFHIQFEKI